MKHIHTRANVLLYVRVRSVNVCAFDQCLGSEKKSKLYYVFKTFIIKKKEITIKKNGNIVTVISILSFLNKSTSSLELETYDCFSKHTVIVTFRRMRSSYVLSSHADLRRQFESRPVGPSLLLISHFYRITGITLMKFIKID
jgi:hypothetical protein